MRPESETFYSCVNLQLALTQLANSSVKADREAIRRLENQTGKSVLEIIEQINELEITRIPNDVNHIRILKPKNKKHTAGAFVGAGLASIALLATNPKEALLGSLVGASTGIAAVSLKKE